MKKKVLYASVLALVLGGVVKVQLRLRLMQKLVWGRVAVRT